MTSPNQTHQDWIKYPTGKIAKGAFCHRCKRYNARHCTVTMICRHQDKILLIQRAQDPEKGKWALPGGYVDWNETLAQAAIRELNEETGLIAKTVTFFGLYDAPNRDKDGRQNIDHCFIATIDATTSPHLDAQEIADLRWFTINQLPEGIAFDHRQMIEDYYGRQPH